jgi:hypothetical protein
VQNNLTVFHAMCDRRICDGEADACTIIYGCIIVATVVVSGRLGTANIRNELATRVFPEVSFTSVDRSSIGN